MTHPDQDIIDFLTKDLDLRAAPDWMIERARAFRDGGWQDIETAPEGVEVETKIDDENGCRNQWSLIRRGKLWFYPDESMYVYYQPTHWRPLPNPPKDTEQ